jgi:hypothetical protein
MSQFYWRPGHARELSSSSDNRKLVATQSGAGTNGRFVQQLHWNEQTKAFKLTSQAKPSPNMEQQLKSAIAVFLPRDFPDSVSPNYLSYVQWQLVACVASSAGMVLSMQSLLYAVGLGAGSIPMAAALNWVIKDGFGQLGGVMFASFINNRFDADPKRWRMISAVALDGSTLLELMSPLAPGLFLPIASVANVGKNVAWLSASATRAGIHRSMARRENLADITGKSGSQSIAGSLIGTTLGIALSPLIGSDTAVVMGAFSILSAIHLGSNYASLQGVVLNTLNPHRFDIVLQQVLAGGGVPSPEEVGAQESFIIPYPGGSSAGGRVRVEMAPGLEILLQQQGKQQGKQQGEQQGEQDNLDRLLKLFADENYILSIGTSKCRTSHDYTVGVLYKEAAKDVDVIAGQQSQRDTYYLTLSLCIIIMHYHGSIIMAVLSSSLSWQSRYRSKHSASSL